MQVSAEHFGAAGQLPLPPLVPHPRRNPRVVRGYIGAGQRGPRRGGRVLVQVAGQPPWTMGRARAGDGGLEGGGTGADESVYAAHQRLVDRRQQGQVNYYGGLSKLLWR